MSCAVQKNSYSQRLRDAICCGNVTEVSRVLDEVSELHFTILVTALHGGACSTVPMIIDYLAPCHALLSEKCIYRGNDWLGRNFRHQAYDVYAFTIRIVFHYMLGNPNTSYENTKQHAVCQLLLERGAPAFQGMLCFHQECIPMPAQQRLQFSTLHEEMLQHLGLPQEEAVNIAYKKELEFEYQQHLAQNKDVFTVLAVFSERLHDVHNAQNGYAHLELINEGLASINGQQIAELLFVSDSNKGNFLQKIGSSCASFQLRLGEEGMLMITRIKKRLFFLNSCHYASQSCLKEKGEILFFICHQIINPLRNTNAEARHISVEYLLKMLEILDKEYYLDFHIATQNLSRSIIIEETINALEKLASAIQSFIAIAPRVEHVETRVGKIIEKISTYIVALKKKELFLRNNELLSL